ncbi:MAG: GTP cyclohydrolase IIa [Halobacteria archaeon]
MQASIIQIDNYGPWTVTPEPRREVDLQALQSRLYADICQHYGSYGGLVFYTRFDNVIAITNGVDPEHHRKLQQTVSNRYPVTVSLGVSNDPNPKKAIGEASSVLQDSGSAQDAGRESRLEIAKSASVDDEVQIAHFDDNDVTSTTTDQVDGFEATLRIQEAYLELARKMWVEHDSMTFFVGGDNFISVTPGLTKGEYMDVVENVGTSRKIDLKVGVGESKTPEEAGMQAKLGLEKCRHNGRDVDFQAGGREELKIEG